MLRLFIYIRSKGIIGHRQLNATFIFMLSPPVWSRSPLFWLFFETHSTRTCRAVPCGFHLHEKKKCWKRLFRLFFSGFLSLSFLSFRLLRCECCEDNWKIETVARPRSFIMVFLLQFGRRVEATRVWFDLTIYSTSTIDLTSNSFCNKYSSGRSIRLSLHFKREQWAYSVVN